MILQIITLLLLLAGFLSIILQLDKIMSAISDFAAVADKLVALDALTPPAAPAA